MCIVSNMAHGVCYQVFNSQLLSDAPKSVFWLLAILAYTTALNIEKQLHEQNKLACLKRHSFHLKYIQC